MMFSGDISWVKCLNGLNLKVVLDCSALNIVIEDLSGEPWESPF